MIKVLSLNVNGLQNPFKQSKILNKLKREKIDVAFLQETHMAGLEHEKLKRQGFKHVYSSSNGTKHTRGVVILISGTSIFEHLSTIKDKKGTYIMVKGKLDGELFTFYNVYVPPGFKSAQYVQIVDRAVTEAQGILVCGGDFNMTLNPFMDSSGSRTFQSQKTTKKINLMLSETGLVDIWRYLKPTNRDYTFYSAPHSSYSRIDYFFAFSTDLNRIQDCSIGARDISDHSPLCLVIKRIQGRKNKHWRLNNSILNNKTCEQFSKEISEYLKINDNGETAPPMVWDACKAVMRGRVIAKTSYLKKQRAELLKTLQSELLTLETKHKGTLDNQTKLEIKKKETR